jgi:hypothetical protein
MHLTRSNRGHRRLRQECTCDSSGWCCWRCPLRAQPRAPIGLVYGSLLECEASGTWGELTLRTASTRIFRFAFDDKTYFERERPALCPHRTRGRAASAGPRTDGGAGGG